MIHATHTRKTWMSRILVIPMLVGALSWSFALANEEQNPVLGHWKTIDDETGKPKSIVDIYLEQDRLYGRIVEIFPEEGKDPDPLCDKCPGHRKDQKIVGMVIIDGLQQKGHAWSEGKILDPEKGKEYRCKIWLEEENLKVRGYILFLHQTQTWLRVR